MAQLTIANSNTQHYVKMLSTATTKPPSTSKFYVDFEKNFFQRSKNWNTPFYLQMFCALSGTSSSWNTLVFSRFTSREHANFIGCLFFFTLMCFLRKALDNIDLNQMSHRYVSGALLNDWNDPLNSQLPLTWSIAARMLYLSLIYSLSYKMVNIVVSSLYYLKKS